MGNTGLELARNIPEHAAIRNDELRITGCPL